MGNSSPRQQELHKQKSEAVICGFITDYAKYSHQFIKVPKLPSHLISFISYSSMKKQEPRIQGKDKVLGDPAWRFAMKKPRNSHFIAFQFLSIQNESDNSN